MKNYNRPNVEVSKFDVADIITSSGIVGAAADLPAGSTEAKLYDAYVTASEIDSANVAIFQW